MEKWNGLPKVTLWVSSGAGLQIDLCLNSNKMKLSEISNAVSDIHYTVAYHDKAKAV